MTAGWFAFLFLLLIIIILISRIDIRVNYCREERDDELIVIVSALYGLVNIKNEYRPTELLLRKGPALKVKGEAVRHSIRKFMVMRDKFFAAFRYIRRKAYIRKLKWHTVFGAGDAATTGIFIGLMWNVKTLIMLIADLAVKPPLMPDLKIIPCFDSAVLRTDFDCILSIRIGHAIIAGTIFLIADKKDGDAIERASNRGVDEYHDGKHKANG